MRFLVIPFLLFLTLGLKAQKCKNAAQRADNALKRARYARAVELYYTAIECHPTKEQSLNRKIQKAARLLAKRSAGKKADRMLPSKVARAAYNEVLVKLILRRDSTLAWAIARYNLQKHPNVEGIRETYAVLSNDPHLWRKQTGVIPITGHKGSINKVLFYHGGQALISTSADSTVRVWDLAGQEIWRYSSTCARQYSAAISPDGSLLLIGGSDGKVLFFPWKTIPGAFADAENTSFLEGSHQGILVSPHYGEYTHQPQPLREFSAHESTVTSLAFSPDGQRILTSGRDGFAKLWDTQSGDSQLFAGHNHIVWSAVFAPFSATAREQILSASSDKMVDLWNPDGTIARQFIGHESMVSSAIFSPIGKYVLSTSGDSTARLWNVYGQRLRHFLGHADAVWSAAFSPDGKYLLTGSWDKTARLWNVSTGKLLQTFAGHTGPIYSVAFSPDGQKIATGSADKTIRLWRIDHDCLECQTGQIGIKELQAAGVQLEPEDWLIER